MNPPRRPTAFRIGEEPPPVQPPMPPVEPRRPRAIADPRAVKPVEVDIFDEPDLVTAEPAPATARRRRSPFVALFMTAFGAFISLAVGLWADRVIRDLFTRADWLGWTALALAIVACLALLAVFARELFGLLRLRSVEKLRSRGADIILRNDTKAARSLLSDLSAFLSAKPETAAGRRALDELRDDVIDGADLVRLAEVELLTPLDQRAQVLILDAAKRVSLVTAVSPRAVVDLAYVVFEAGRLIRRLADLYGGRPGTLGFFRLARDVLAHLAVTGTVAFGDSLVQQLVGQGLAARLSARLGEGVVNGMMTARIGLAAMEMARPLPFNAVRRPGIGDFLSALTTFARTRQKAGTDEA